MQRNSDTAKEQTSLDFYEKCAFACSYEYVWCYYARCVQFTSFIVIFRKKVCVCEHANHHGIGCGRCGKCLKLPLCHLTEHQEQKMEK
jgi:hypothetical protein